MKAGTTTHVITAQEAGQRLDKVLASLPAVGSRGRARQALRSGKVTVDESPVGPEQGGDPVAEGSRIAIRWNQPGTGARRTAARASLRRADVAILYEDDAILVVDKPAGLLTDAATRGQALHRDTLRKRVDAWLGAEGWPAHRIDRDTSGVVAFAKTRAARESLHDQWVAREPLRAYLVVVEGVVPDDAGRFADWMRWDARARRQRPCAPGDEGAWYAEADFEVMRRFGDRAARLEVRLVSGRRNQIRLHAMLAGHPLVGETTYRREGRSPIRFGRQALHAHRLGLRHPSDGRAMSFEAPIPSDLAALLRRLERG